MTEANWQPCREPFLATIRRTGAIAIVLGGILAAFGGGLRRWPLMTLIVLWPAFGGHWVEVWFLNWANTYLTHPHF